MVARLLQQRNPRHLTLGLLDAFARLRQALGGGDELQGQVLSRLILDLRLWSAASASTQRHVTALYKTLAKVCGACADFVPLRGNPFACSIGRLVGNLVLRSTAGVLGPM